MARLVSCHRRENDVVDARQAVDKSVARFTLSVRSADRGRVVTQFDLYP